ncbi:MAG: response regulator transcription factor [Terriglobales bacterium]
MKRVLIIEDDPVVQEVLQLLLEVEGYEVKVASDGPSGLEYFQRNPPSAVILDLSLPGMHGRDVCRALQQQAPRIPMIVLSGALDEIDKVLLLELGADDYVTKPFSSRELLARLHAVQRRAASCAGSDAGLRLRFADVLVDFEQMESFRGSRPVPLTSLEFKILRYFAERPKRVIPREALLKEVWGYQCYPSTRTVDTHMLNLRQKLEPDPNRPAHFLTVHGTGYKFVP